MGDFILGKYAVKRKEHDLCPSIWNVSDSDVTSMIEYNRLDDITSNLNLQKFTKVYKKGKRSGISKHSMELRWILYNGSF